MVVGYYDRNTAGNSNHVPMYWTEDAGMVGVPLEPGWALGRMTDVSGNGNVAVGHGGTGFHDAAHDTVAFRWTADSGYDFIPSTPAYDVSTARAISSNSEVVIGALGELDSDGRSWLSFQPYRWTESGGVQLLGGLPGHDSAGALAISSDGSTTMGYSSISGDASSRTTVFWDADGEITETIPRYASDGSWFTPGLMSGDGSTLAGTYHIPVGPSSHITKSGIWTEDTGVLDLAIILESLGVDLQGYELQAITGISEDGLRIIGRAEAPDFTDVAFVATIPEPSTALLLGCGLAVLGRRRAAVGAG